MPNYVMIAMADAKPGQDAEFNEWYDTIHMAEVCAIPGVKSGRRLQAQPNAAFEAPTRYLTIYELETDDPDAVLQELNRRVTSGEMRMSATLEPQTAAAFFYRPV